MPINHKKTRRNQRGGDKTNVTALINLTPARAQASANFKNLYTKQNIEKLTKKPGFLQGIKNMFTKKNKNKTNSSYNLVEGLNRLFGGKRRTRRGKKARKTRRHH